MDRAIKNYIVVSADRYELNVGDRIYWNQWGLAEGIITGFHNVESKRFGYWVELIDSSGGYASVQSTQAFKVLKNLERSEGYKKSQKEVVPSYFRRSAPHLQEDYQPDPLEL